MGNCARTARIRDTGSPQFECILTPTHITLQARIGNVFHFYDLAEVALINGAPCLKRDLIGTTNKHIVDFAHNLIKDFRDGVWSRANNCTFIGYYFRHEIVITHPRGNVNSYDALYETRKSLTEALCKYVEYRIIFNRNTAKTNKIIISTARRTVDQIERVIAIAYITICAAFAAMPADVCTIIGRLYLELIVQDITAPHTFHGLPTSFNKQAPWAAHRRNWYLRTIESYTPNIMSGSDATSCYIRALSDNKLHIYVDNPTWGIPSTSTWCSFKIISIT